MDKIDKILEETGRKFANVSKEKFLSLQAEAFKTLCAIPVPIKELKEADLKRVKEFEENLDVINNFCGFVFTSITIETINLPTHYLDVLFSFLEKNKNLTSIQYICDCPFTDAQKARLDENFKRNKAGSSVLTFLWDLLSGKKQEEPATPPPVASRERKSVASL